MFKLEERFWKTMDGLEYLETAQVAVKGFLFNKCNYIVLIITITINLNIWFLIKKCDIKC